MKQSAFGIFLEIVIGPGVGTVPSSSNEAGEKDFYGLLKGYLCSPDFRL